MAISYSTVVGILQRKLQFFNWFGITRGLGATTHSRRQKMAKESLKKTSGQMAIK